LIDGGHQLCSRHPEKLLGSCTKKIIRSHNLDLGNPRHS
jgi:hypothetical protein